MLLTDKCRHVDNLVNSYSKRAEIKIEAQRLGIYQNEISVIKNRLSIIDRVNLYLEYNIIAYSDIPKVNELRKKIAEIKSIFENDYKQLNESNKFNILKDNINELVTNLNLLIRENWAAWYRRQRENEMKDDLLAAFVSIDTHLINQLITIKKELDEYKNSIPTDREEIIAIKELLDRYGDLKSKLPFDNLPEDVQIFLKEANSAKGAPLYLLTPDVIIWLQKNNIYEKLVIKSKGAEI